jgi:hypothetical protein
MKTNYTTKTCFLLFIFLCININLQSQEKPLDQSIDSLILNYSSLYKEVVYIHLNKSIYIKGEFIGFTSYIFSKHNNKLSEKTSNLYCVIYDDNQNIIKKQMVKVENGIANGNFIIDDDFKKGNYTFKAYTNWMLNFSQESFFTDSFEVIDPSETKFIKKKKLSNKIDIQVLPESGHLLTNVNNTLGIIAKDSLGYGYPYLKGNVLDENNNFITSFRLNELGIGRFSMTPKKNTTYKIVINNGINKTIKFGQELKDRGMILKLNRNKNHLIVATITNQNTLPFLKNKTYTIRYHNGSKYTKIKINFNKVPFIAKKTALVDLNKGINIFTLLDSNDQPIAERLFFNYNNIKIHTFDNFTSQIQNDTVFNFNLSLKKGIKEFNNVSISVLPKGTKSYKKNSNIISNLLIKPYIKGYLENGGYYFTNINNQKKYNLDNLLITQGWSSFEWKSIFSDKTNYTHAFEKGISLKINSKGKKNKSSSYFVHSSANRNPEFITIEKGENKKYLVLDNFYPMDDESVYISKVRKRDGKLGEISLDTQFFPAKVPETDKGANYLINNTNFYALESASELWGFKTVNIGNVLDEVVIKANSEKKRIQKIKSKAIGAIKFIKKDEISYNLAEYINTFGVGFTASEINGELVIGKNSVIAKNNNFAASDSIASTLVNSGTVIYLDGLRIINNDVLFNYSMSIVDYIEFDRLGFGEGIRGNSGVIRIVTDPFKFHEDKKNPTLTAIKFPLTFTNEKQFYVPKYKSYKSNFYENYGVINWLPKNRINENGLLNLQINNIKTDEITFFIEGVSEAGEFIFDKKTIRLGKKL